MRFPMIGIVLLALVLGSSTAYAGESGWLSLGAKGWSPSITSKSGIGTAHATAEAKATRQDIVDWCASWTPDASDCVAREMATDEVKKTYRASADCMRGTITPVDGASYTFAGVWDASDIGAGRTRWQDAAGQIVGRDNASGGLAISQQWEELCPGPLKIPPAKGTPLPAAKAPAPAAAAGAFAVGDVIEAKYGREWIRGRIDKIRPGPEYDVRLDNGQRGILPPRMIRKAGP
ncbi:MAG: tudor domain-containing protein [Candidatus Binatia bacterium]